MALMGLDIGTTGCKATIFSFDGAVLNYAYREYAPECNSYGYAEINPEKVWESVTAVIVKSAGSVKGDDVTAICISSFGESAIPVGADGSVLHNSLLYTDPRGMDQCEELKQRLGTSKIMELVGVNAHPMYTISKVMWFRDNKPDIYQRAWKFLLFQDFIIYRLSGIACIDYSLASRTMAFNVTSLKWEKEIFDAAAIREDIFAEAVPSGTVVGSIKSQIASELGLSLGVKVVTGGHDQVCAAVGAGIIKAGRAIDGTGTVECITPTFDRPLLNRFMLENNYACVPHAVPGMYVTYAFNFTGGSLLKWYRDHFAQGEKIKALETGQNTYDILNEAASKEPTKILVLPHFAGAGTPYMDVSAKGAIVGLDFNVTPAKLYRALMEGVTYEMRYNLDCLGGAGIEVDELRAVGGGARSQLWLQIKADIMGKKVVTLNVDEAGTVGTAILAGVATGVYKSFEEAVELLVKEKEAYYPNLKIHDFYMNQYEKYKKMYVSISNIMS